MPNNNAKPFCVLMGTVVSVAGACVFCFGLTALGVPALPVAVITASIVLVGAATSLYLGHQCDREEGERIELTRQKALEQKVKEVYDKIEEVMNDNELDNQGKKREAKEILFGSFVRGDSRIINTQQQLDVLMSFTINNSKFNNNEILQLIQDYCDAVVGGPVVDGAEDYTNLVDTFVDNRRRQTGAIGSTGYTLLLSGASINGDLGL